ncbi:HAD family hydrolase [Terriglobus aquaticus]|uniref:HAD family hydrolase n=1 Tax=Terriglobus aquaticus TaxID=940139 RepID=A0ABW9KJ68_9BACT|nr:HAD family hydrolase [Terriglobus aquaticus]
MTAGLLNLQLKETRQTLLFDADDTLWENNIYFDRAIAGFIDLLAHPTWSAEEVRSAFNQLEHERVAVHGYGAISFRSSMLAAIEQFHCRACTSAEVSRIHELTASILEARIELLPGVAETLTDLATRHTLVLMTKGAAEEQTEKLRRSGLAPLFAHVEVVREKHREAYLDLRSRHRHDAATTWMVGNSPRSDINPALAAGLHAVFLPHPNTWVLEHESVAPAPPGQHLLELNSIRELLQIF